MLHKECSLFEDLVLVLVMTALQGLRVNNPSICFRGWGKGLKRLSLLWRECEGCVADCGLLLYKFLEWRDGKYPAHLGSIASVRKQKIFS